MKQHKRRMQSLLLALMLPMLTAQAELNQQGTVVTLSNFAASGNTSLAESWSWIQLSSLVSGICAGSDAGAGNLAHIAFPDSERANVAAALSAYLSGKPVRVIVDEANLYQGNCRLKQLVL